MAKKRMQTQVRETDKLKMAQFRQDLASEVDKAIDHHEFKMVYIGFATLFAFAGCIYLSVRFQLPFFN